MELGVFPVVWPRLILELLALLSDQEALETERRLACRLLLSRVTDVLENLEPLRGNAERQFRAAEGYVQENFDRAIDRGSCASALGISRTQLSRLYQEFHSQSFQENLERLRMDKARLYLMDTDLSIRDIAAGCGYRSDAYFIRVFRERYGQPPQKWRKHSSV